MYSDFAVRFDGNTYTAPPWTIGKKLTLKADQHEVTLYHKQKVVARHTRCRQRYQRIELPQHRELVKKIQKKIWQDRDVAVFAGLGETAREYLAGLSRASQPIKKNVCRLLGLKDRWGLQPLLAALQKAMKHKAYGADYIENILHQMGNPTNTHPPVTLKDQNLNNIRLEEPNLADYDGLILKRRNDDD